MNATAEGVQTRRIAADSGREYILQHDGAAAPGSQLVAQTPGLAPAFGVPGSLDIQVMAAPDDVAAALGGGGGSDASDDDVEWESVENGRAGSGLGEGEAGSAPGQSPRDWRTRMIERQKFWSHMHGFKMGCEAVSVYYPVGFEDGLLLCN